MVITMSRRFGTGASEIARQLSEKLHIPVYDKAYIEHELDKSEYETESEVIKNLASESCIILGRCASEILKGRPDVLNIYVVADMEDRIKRIMQKENLSYEEAKKLIKENDKKRSEYYNKNTGKLWGDVNNYQMIMDTTMLGIDKCAGILLKYLKRIEII